MIPKKLRTFYCEVFCLIINGIPHRYVWVWKLRETLQDIYSNLWGISPQNFPYRNLYLYRTYMFFFFLVRLGIYVHSRFDIYHCNTFANLLLDIIQSVFLSTKLNLLINSANMHWIIRRYCPKQTELDLCFFPMLKTILFFVCVQTYIQYIALRSIER